MSGHEEDNIIPETYIDYEENPTEYSLNTLQTVVRVHTRVSDLYNNPYNQLEEQLRLSIESIKERQEWELHPTTSTNYSHWYGRNQPSSLPTQEPSPPLSANVPGEVCLL